MRVGWLADPGNGDGTLGGAEYTQQEFRDLAPDGVQIVDCPPGQVAEGLDGYVVHNCVHYGSDTISRFGSAPVIKYCHDVWPHGDPDLRSWLLERAQLVFTSPLHEHRFPWASVIDAKLCPPAVDLTRYRAAALTRHGSSPGGSAVWLGHFHTHGKGIHRAIEWANQTGGTLDFYGDGPLAPQETDRIKVKGPLPPEDVPDTLASYDRLVMLPDRVEPFGRSVVEAWAAGCDLVVNGLVGAAWWIQTDPETLQTAGDRFWQIVTEAVA